MKNIITKIVGWMNRIPADKYKHQALGRTLRLSFCWRRCGSSPSGWR